MSEFRYILEHSIKSGLDQQTRGLLDICFTSPLQDKVRFIQHLNEWMILEQLCRYGLRTSVSHYMHHVRVDTEEALWAIEVCAQNNSPSVFEFLKRPEFCNEEIAQNLYQNHPLTWIKCRQHFSSEIQKQAEKFGSAQGFDHPLNVFRWEQWDTANGLKGFVRSSQNPDMAVWAAVANCPKVFDTAIDTGEINWKQLGKEFLEWPLPYKNGDNKILDTAWRVLQQYTETDCWGTLNGLNWAIREHFSTHKALGLRMLVSRFGEKETLKLCKFLGNSLIWKIEQNPAVLDGMPKIADYLHKSNIQSLAASDICYSILPYTSRSYRSGLNSVLRKHAKETLKARVEERRNVMENVLKNGCSQKQNRP